MAALGDAPAVAHLGPCIRAGLLRVRRPGARRRSSTASAPASAAPPRGARRRSTSRRRCTPRWREAGVDRGRTTRSGCTACDRRWYSHRARGEVGALRHHRLAGGVVTDLGRQRLARVRAAHRRRRRRSRADHASSRSPKGQPDRRGGGGRAGGPGRHRRELRPGAGGQGGRPARGARRALALHRRACSATRCGSSPRTCTCGSPSTGCRWPAEIARHAPGRRGARAGERERRRAAGRLPAGAGGGGGGGVRRPRPRRARPDGHRSAGHRRRGAGGVPPRCASSPTASASPSGRWA